MNQVVVKPFRSSDTAVDPAPQVVETAAAQTAAALFTADYLTFDPTRPQAAENPLRSSVVNTADTGLMIWKGTGWLAADLVVPGTVTAVDPTHAVVAVSARVQTGAPAAASTPVPAQTSAPPPGRAANTAALPAGYHLTGAIWVDLRVPVMTAGSDRVLVDSGGPVFSNNTPPEPISGNEDAAVTAQTQHWPTTFFTAYAGSEEASLDYLTTPNSRITGLGGAVTLAGVQGWQLRSDVNGQRTGTAQVTWRLGPNLTVGQNYTVIVAGSGGRWFADSVGPVTTSPFGGTS